MDSRVKIWENHRVFKYFEVFANPHWVGKTKFNKEMRSYDNGQTYMVETN